MIKIGLVTAWGECGMGYLAKNWVYTFRKYPEIINYQIYSRALPWLSPFRWQGEDVVNGPETMDINQPHFWDWVNTFKPDVILFQDQNIYGKTEMREESLRLKQMGIKLINYPDWIRRGDVEKYKGLYDVNLSHVLRNYHWLVNAKVENPTLIKWGVITKNFPFISRQVADKIKFYINVGTGTIRKGYTAIPKALSKMEGNFIQRKLNPRKYNYQFITSSVQGSENRIDKAFFNYFRKHTNCEIIFKTADNQKGGLYSLGDIYVYPSMREGIGLTITEAMCTGMPVITSDFPTMNEWVDDNVDGRLIKIKKIKKSSMPTHKVLVDENHLADILIDYINNPEKVTEQSINARRKIENKYNWDDRDQEILRILQ